MDTLTSHHINGTSHHANGSRPVTADGVATQHRCSPEALDEPQRLCGIVPPYLLEALRSSADPELQQIAEHTLRHDDAFRAARRPGAAQGPTGVIVADVSATHRHTTPPTTDGNSTPPESTPPESTPPGSTPPGSTPGAAHPVRQICDAHHGTSLPGAVVRAEGAAASSDTAVNEAYDGLGDTWKLYHDVYGRDSVDGRGLMLVGSVHYSRNYDNAFWNGSQMVFGDGDGVIFTRFTASVDVIGHELTHGVTQYTAALAYSDQPGALNESVSDVFGSLVKQYSLGQTADQADWLIGAGILGPKIKGRALRDMLHPGTAYDDPQLGKDPQPADMAHYVQTSDDNGGVHTNSGIPNRAFALAATTAGGKAWEGVGQVWYDVLTGSAIQARCDFATFARLTVAAATTRFGADHGVTAAVRQAWQTVGVLEAGAQASGADAPNSQTPNPPAGNQSPVGQTPASVRVRRTGGFAGVARESTVHLDQLPGHDADAWRGLLASGQLSTLAAAPTSSRPDGYQYAVSCPDPHVEVTLAEQVLPTHVRHLLDRTLDAD